MRVYSTWPSRHCSPCPGPFPRSGSPVHCVLKQPVCMYRKGAQKWGGPSLILAFRGDRHTLESLYTDFSLFVSVSSHYTARLPQSSIMVLSMRTHLHKRCTVYDDYSACTLQLFFFHSILLFLISFFFFLKKIALKYL